jgi:exosortase
MTQAWRTVRSALLVLVPVFLWSRPFLRTMELAWRDDAYTHILLILPLTCGFFYLDRKQLRFSPAADRSGALWLVIALLLAGFERWGLPATAEEIRLSLSMLALVAWWVGGMILVFSGQTLKAFLFPLCFTFLIVPLPSVALDEVIYFLQNESALAARIMFKLAGVPVTQDGVMLSIPNLDIEVARECSSIRSSLMLLITTMFLAHLFLRSWWRRALLIACAIPMAAIKNGLRIFVITELATRVDYGFFNGNLHRRGGIVFLAIAVGVMVTLLWILRRTETVEAPARIGLPAN